MNSKQDLTAQQRFLRTHRRNRRMVCLIRLICLGAFLGLWEWASDTGRINGFIFSSPSQIAECFWNMAKDRSIFLHVGVTLGETLVSFFLAVLIGLGAALLLWSVKSVARVLEPYLVVLNSLPKSALAPLLIVWLGANTRTIIVVGVSLAVFGTVLNLYTGFCQVDQEQIKLIYTLGGTKRQVLSKVIVPSTVPLLLSVMKVDIGLSLVGVVIGEFLAARAGLGYLIIYGSQVFQLNLVMMSIIVLCVIALALYQIVALVEKRLISR